MIYIDSDFKCYTSNADGRTAVESVFFDGKCTAFVEGYRFVPEGSVWTRDDEQQFNGEMIAPWKDYAVLAAAQEQYEIMLAEQEDMQTALETLGVSVDG